jgi:hypothetical protein
VLVPLSILWYRLIIEELVVYQIMSHGCRIKYNDVIEVFEKKARSAIDRLVSKNIVEQMNDDILLKKRDYKFSMTR